MNPRTEPLLWIQLLGLAVLPLEALLLLVVLAGSDPGPAPVVEEVLCWTLGALAPALLLWRTPADVWSLLLVQIPAQGRSDLQRRLSRLQDTLLLKLLGPALGALALLPLLVRLDQRAAIAAPLWTSGSMPRLAALLLGAVLLSLMLWQWQEVVQALWLLSRSQATLQAVDPLSSAELAQTRLSPGIPLLLPPPLTFSGAAPLRRNASSPPPADEPAAPAQASAIDGSPLPIEPEQGAADDDSGDLDQPVA